jgi:transcription elongation factor Elf1
MPKSKKVSEPQLPTGFKCTQCGEEHIFPSYVFAHWDEHLTHTCPNCGARHSVYQGEADAIND